MTTPSQRAREIAERIWKLWDSGHLSTDGITAEIEPVVEELGQLRSARGAYNAAADQITHKRCENLQREIEEEWLPRTQRAERLALDLREALRNPCPWCAQGWEFLPTLGKRKYDLHIYPKDYKGMMAGMGPHCKHGALLARADEVLR